MDIYIIVSQHFFVSNSTYYQVADDNPIIGVYESLDDAKSACERIVNNMIEVFSYTSKIIDPTPGRLAKYGLYHGDTCMIMYTIVQDIV